MKLREWAKALLPIALTALAACSSPEADRTMGGGPGADLGNRRQHVAMHEGSEPYAGTPRLIPAEAPPLVPARQARRLSLRG